jgi:hypothetical protein
MRTEEAEAYQEVVNAAWPLHRAIWFYGENNVWPDALRPLADLDDVLAEALSYAPPEDSP